MKKITFLVGMMALQSCEVTEVYDIPRNEVLKLRLHSIQ
jgi:hypothetical protein